jgi:hypothetical protein
MKDTLRDIVKNCAKTNQPIIRQLVVFLASSGEGTRRKTCLCVADRF